MMLGALLLLAAQGDPVAALDAELLAARSATAVLQKRCPERIRAEVDRGAASPASAETRVRLGAGAKERIAYRSVRLMCGTRVYSRAENWYLPDRLKPAMNAALAGDTPFGVAIAEYAPIRRTVSTERLSGADVLRHRALVLAPDRPLAEVVETYTAEALAGD